MKPFGEPMGCLFAQDCCDIFYETDEVIFERISGRLYELLYSRFESQLHLRLIAELAESLEWHIVDMLPSRKLINDTFR